MNRYRTMPGLGPPKASASTTCQKCLKKDDYECKATAQDRPYVSRPSRSQQFNNPKLKPKLASDIPNELLRSQGIADEQLARAEANRAVEKRSQSPDRAASSERRRSRSASSSDSVATISTNRSKSQSLPRDHDTASRSHKHLSRERRSRSRSASRTQKRKRGDLADSSTSRSPPRFNGTNKSRRYGSTSPEDRGRQVNDRRGSHRSRTSSIDRSEATKQRRSLDSLPTDASKGHGEVRLDEETSHRHEHYRRQGMDGMRPRQTRMPASRRQRSLSPYSRRLALTQAMNMEQ